MFEICDIPIVSFCYLLNIYFIRCELRDPAGQAYSDICWNPDQGLNIVTASGDDKNPVLKLWDLRSSTSLPLATLSGHSEGILSCSWCPTNPSWLMSCGKDNRTIVWDLFSLQPVFDLPSDVSHNQQAKYTDSSQERSADDGFGGGGLGTAVGQRRYHVAWSPCLPAIMSACTFDRRIQFVSMSGARSKNGKHTWYIAYMDE